MQVAAGQDGIQRLLAAEKEAQQIVAKARKGTLDVNIHCTTCLAGATSLKGRVQVMKKY